MHIIATESAVIRVLKDGTPLPPQAHLEEPDMDVRLPVFQKCEVLSCRDHGIPEKNYRFVKAMARKEVWVVAIKRTIDPVPLDQIHEMITVVSSVRATSGNHVTVRGWVISTAELSAEARKLAESELYVITTDAKLR